MEANTYISFHKTSGSQLLELTQFPHYEARECYYYPPHGMLVHCTKESSSYSTSFIKDILHVGGNLANDII